jgi:hypothetical protein
VQASGTPFALSQRSQFVQYPLRPAWHDIVGSSVSSCKFKPIQQQLKIVVGTNVASPNIDLDHATFPQVEQSFNSVQVPSSASYFAGFWSGTQDNELLQLVPLSGVLQMRPDFKYIDESAQAQLRLNAEQDKAEEQETIDISDGDDGNDDPVYVQASYLATPRTYIYPAAAHRCCAGCYQEERERPCKAHASTGVVSLSACSRSSRAMTPVQSFAYREQLQAQETAIDLQYHKCVKVHHFTSFSLPA